MISTISARSLVCAGSGLERSPQTALVDTGRAVVVALITD
jgi:hypothetical protein